MARRKKHEEHLNHEAWAIPYGDLITLLLAFFVVMYAVSSVNEGKYRVLADSLVAAFRAPPRSLEPIQIGPYLVRADEEIPTGLPRTLVPFEVDGRMVPEQKPVEVVHEASRRPDGGAPVASAENDSSFIMIERLADEVIEAMAPLIEADLIRVQRVSFWLEVEINTSFLFASGSATVAADAQPAISRLAQLLAAADVRLQVEGHTDSVPISTAQFPSNWELSAGRAASVVHLLAAHGVDPAAMAAVGYGEHRPVAGNDTAEGRRQNRRVLIVVLSGKNTPRDPALSSRDAPGSVEAAETGEKAATS
ncbi:flagellar motor protein MotD [Thioalkalivibrio sp. XN279]|uniref:flagellar motor protein MotD n=1 Tax=Thioalkalivibrio sp. XN279 TaxID=2714953 RepID=UPI001409A1FD|nr:flagellar motor protein MotD [Thioalkalivibrio sp. XN279]NHA13567.1 flagellar motor protein MotD [Thioalkalivibrio sp. XN279]